MTDTSTNWAVVEIGGKQHLVLAGTKIEINQLAANVGEQIKLKSLLDETPVTLEVVSHQLGEKVHGLKFKNKIRYIRRYGHRQHLTTLAVKTVGEAKKTTVAPAKEAQVKKATSKTPAKAKTAKKASSK